MILISINSHNTFTYFSCHVAMLLLRRLPSLYLLCKHSLYMVTRYINLKWTILVVSSQCVSHIDTDSDSKESKLKQTTSGYSCLTIASEEQVSPNYLLHELLVKPYHHQFFLPLTTSQLSNAFTALYTDIRNSIQLVCMTSTDTQLIK